MKTCRFNRFGCRAAAPAALAVLTAGPALAATTTASASACTMPALSQPFASYGDSSEYAFVPGETLNSFAGTGWTLTGGAKIVTTALAGGTTGEVLDIPSGAQAVSPPMCVQSDYPNARMMIDEIVGHAGVTVLASYAGAAAPVNAGTVHDQTLGAWSMSGQLHTHPGTLAGWQLVQFTLMPGGASGESRIYNFCVDPRMTS